MSTVTLTFNPANTFAQSVLEMLRQSGAFDVSEEQTLPEDEWTEEEEREAFLHTSKLNASKMFSKYL